MFTYDEYQEFCGDNGVRLNGAIDLAAKTCEVDAAIYTPSSSLAAVAQAGMMLRTLGPRPLSNRPFPAEALQIEEIGMNCLVAIVNATHASDTSVADQSPKRKPKRLDQTTRPVGVCDKAEGYFYETVADIQTGRAGDNNGYHIIHEDGDPALLTKRRGEPSTVALRRTIAAGIPFPPGSLFRADIQRSAFGTEPVRMGTTKYDVVAGATEIIPYSAVAKLVFLRLSALSLPPNERHIFVPKVSSLTGGGLTVRDELTIDDIRQLLTAVVQTHRAALPR